MSMKKRKLQVTTVADVCVQPSPAVKVAPCSVNWTLSRRTWIAKSLCSPGAATTFKVPPSGPLVDVTVAALAAGARRAKATNIDVRSRTIADENPRDARTIRSGDEARERLVEDL